MRIVLQPAPMELGLFHDQYDALVDELRTEGHDVEIVPREEWRSHFPPEPETFYNLLVLVRESPEYPIAAAWLVDVIRRRLKGKLGRRTRTAMLHLPRDEKHYFEIPDED